jgi:hypothetical protein
MSIAPSKHRSCRRVSAAFVVASLAVSTAMAQQLLLEIPNPDRIPDGDGFGYSVALAGDIDGDGVSDALIAAPFQGHPSTGSREGAVYVVSGANGNVLRTHTGPEPIACIGIGQMAAGADIDGDGVPDYVLGTLDVPRPTSEGTAYVYSGATGNLLYTLIGERKNDGLCCPRFVGDVDADGVEDLALISPGFNVSSTKTTAGRAYIYSGATMAVLFTVTGTRANLYMTPVCGIGDVDFDGHADISVGWDGWEAGPNGEGKFEVYSGATGTMLYRRVGEAADDFFGHSETRLGDVDGDGNPDFMVRAPGHDLVDTEGRVYVYSGPSGRLIRELDGRFKDENFGTLPIDGPIDLNGDGFDDILIGTEYVPSGGGTGTGPADSSVFAYSGRTGRLLYEFRGTVFGQISESLGCSLASFGDFDGDGIDDVILGACAWSDAMWSSAGRAYVYAGNDLFLQANQESYVANDSITVTNRGGVPGALSMIVLTAVNGTATFVPIVIGTLDANGELGIQGTVPSGLSGLTLQFMGYAQKASGHGIADSIAETITFN